MSLLHGEVRPTCSANGQKVAIIGTLTLYGMSTSQARPFAKVVEGSGDRALSVLFLW